MTQSMSRRANCCDNSPMESFFKTLKVECFYQLRYDTREQARLDTVEWIEDFYNRERIHTSLVFQSPMTVEVHAIAA